MVKLVESLVVFENDEVVLKQRVDNEDGNGEHWLNAPFSKELDQDGHSTEEAFLMGLSIGEKTSVEDVRSRLVSGEIIYIHPPTAKEEFGAPPA